MTKKTTVSCGKFLDVAHVEDLKKRFVAAIKKQPEILEAHADKVERTDSAGIQLLLAVQNKCTELKIVMKMPKATDTVTDTLERLGLSQQLNFK